ncbi:MAG TPA: TM2 domain-containing protein [Myxococcales bacterium]
MATQDVVEAVAAQVRHCRNCGKEVQANAVACLSCGRDPTLGESFCARCGASTAAGQLICVKCGFATAAVPGEAGEKSKVAAGLLAIFLGCFGIHKFYLGYTKAGIIALVISIGGGAITLGISAYLMAVIGLIEGIIYLTKSDQAFTATYVRRQRQWF